MYALTVCSSLTRLAPSWRGFHCSDPQVRTPSYRKLMQKRELDHSRSRSSILSPWIPIEVEQGSSQGKAQLEEQDSGPQAHGREGLVAPTSSCSSRRQACAVSSAWFSRRSCTILSTMLILQHHAPEGSALGSTRKRCRTDTHKEMHRLWERVR